MKEFIIKHWLTVLFTAISSLVTWVVAKLRRGKINGEALKAISICLILQMHETYHSRGYILPTELKVVEDLNSNYKALGGNGTARALMADLEALPNSPPEKSKKTATRSS